MKSSKVRVVLVLAPLLVAGSSLQGQLIQSSALETTQSFLVGVHPINMAVGDFNHDAIPDLAVVEQIKNDVLVLLGDGTGHRASSSVTLRAMVP